MGITCLSECGACRRHVRCGERRCPFCGVAVRARMRVLPYRLLNRLERSRAFSLGAALAAAGIASGCDSQGGPAYGAPCNPPECGAPASGSGGGGAPSGGGPATPTAGDGGESGQGGDRSD
jgi:hypothetical protein